MKLVFIHGAGNTGLVWHYQSEHFPESDAISLPGHPEGQPRTSIEGYADWLHDYVLQRKYDAPVLVGHSMGGGVAQTYALKYPQDAKALVLIGTGARLRVRPDFLNLIEAGIGQPPDYIKRLLEPLYGTVEPWLRDMVIEKVAEVGARVQLNDFQCCDKFDIMDKIQSIKAPTLVICGTQDDMTPVKYSQYLADKIKGSKLVIIEGATHMVFMEKPEEVNRAIEQFLRDLSLRGIPMQSG
ncbi:MAG: alpha/beta hydrolase [Chloroflexi bacterium]|nr:alpha/beta hydrolase [Chloroflexota bacterium]